MVGDTDWASRKFTSSARPFTQPIRVRCFSACQGVLEKAGENRLAKGDMATSRTDPFLRLAVSSLPSVHKVSCGIDCHMRVNNQNKDPQGAKPFICRWFMKEC